MTATAAYGLTIEGLAPTAYLALLGETPQIALRLQQSREPCPVDETSMDAHQGVVFNPIGGSVVDRASKTMTLHTPEVLGDDELVHPLLWPGAAIYARWLGRETLHGGAFLDDGGGAWVVLGNSGHGKSSTLAALALSGREVLADDLIVIDGDDCHAGPRCIDLTTASVAGLGIEGQTSTVRWSERERLRLEPITARSPLRGFVHLDWSLSTEVTSVPPRERLGLLAGQRRVTGLGVDPLRLLELSAMPALRLSRPRDWRQLGGACAQLVQAANNFTG